MVKASFRTLTTEESLDRIKDELGNLNAGINTLALNTGEIARSLAKIAAKISDNKV